MKRLLALALLLSAFGCRSAPIAVPDLPADALLINQAQFEKAVQQRIGESCVRVKKPGAAPEPEPLGRSVLCETSRMESGTR